MGGGDALLRVYDARMPVVPAALFCPSHLRGAALGDAHITGAAWSANGEKIVATYNDGEGRPLEITVPRILFLAPASLKEAAATEGGARK